MRKSEKKRERMRKNKNFIIFILVFSLTYKIWYLLPFKNSQTNSNPHISRARDVFLFLTSIYIIGSGLDGPNYRNTENAKNHY